MNQSIYHSKLNLIETEKAIKLIKDTFEIQLAKLNSGFCSFICKRK